MNISIIRIGDKFSLRFDILGLDGCLITNTLEIGWQEATRFSDCSTSI